MNNLSFIFVLLGCVAYLVLGSGIKQNFDKVNEKLDKLQPKVDTVIVTDTLWCDFEAGCPK